jgi:hypothetical protein
MKITGIISAIIFVGTGDTRSVASWRRVSLSLSLLLSLASLLLCLIFYCYYVPFSIFCVLFVCKCVLYCCHRVSTRLRLHIYIYIYICMYIYHIIYLTAVYWARYEISPCGIYGGKSDTDKFSFYPQSLLSILSQQCTKPMDFRNTDTNDSNWRRY